VELTLAVAVAVIMEMVHLILVLLAVQAVAVKARQAQFSQANQELLTQEAVVVAVLMMHLALTGQGVLVALALLFCLYQQSTTQAQQLAHRQSRQAVHTQF
jgi:hypothetical protein